MAPTKQALKYIDFGTRLFPFLVGLACLFMAERLVALNSLQSVHTWVSWFWPYYAGAAGIVTIFYGLFPRNTILLATSGAMVVSLFFSRALGSVFQLLVGTNNISIPQLHIAGIMYTIGAAACALIWVKVFRPSTHLLKAHETIIRGTVEGGVGL